MKTYLKVDDRNRRLIMDKSFDKNRRIVGSQEYALLQMAKADHPTYAVVLKHIKTNPAKRVYKNLTYTYMREYIAKHPFAEARMQEFEEKMLRAKCHLEGYGKIKQWFLEAYPDISDFAPEQLHENQETDTATDNCEIMESARIAEAPLPLAS